MEVLLITGLCLLWTPDNPNYGDGSPDCRDENLRMFDPVQGQDTDPPPVLCVQDEVALNCREDRPAPGTTIKVPEARVELDWVNMRASVSSNWAMTIHIQGCYLEQTTLFCPDPQR